MNNIFKFDRTAKLGRGLQRSAEDLITLYETLENYYAEMVHLEEHILKEEQKYNKLLKNYADAVGIENVEVEFLELASAHVRVNENGILEGE